VTLNGRHAGYWRLLGNLRRSLAQREEAVAAYSRAVEIDRDNLGLRLGGRSPGCRSSMPMSPTSRPDDCEYAADLADLERLAAASPTQMAAAASQVGDSQPFYLSYQGRCDRDLQLRYGNFVAAAMAASMPDLPRPAAPDDLAGRRLRVGFATAYFHNHSVSKLFKGWPEQLDRQRFEVIGYDLGPGGDGMAQAMAAACDLTRGNLGETRAWPMRSSPTGSTS